MTEPARKFALHTSSVRLPVTVLLISLGVALLLTYIIFQARFMILGPLVTISSPHTGSQVEGALVSIEGSVTNATRIELNNRQIFVDNTGHFQEDLLLPLGYTTYTLSAMDRFGRMTERQLSLIRIN